jgi:hypothetical protein
VVAVRVKTKARMAAAVEAVEAGDKAAVRGALRPGKCKRSDPAFVSAAWAAYSDEQTGQAIMHATGCSADAASALIEEGGTNSPPFRTRWARICALANAKLDGAKVDALASITTGLEDAGQAVADMMHLARQDVAKVREEGGTFESAHAKAPVGLLRDAVTTLDKAGAHLRAVKDGRQPGETPLEQVLGQAFAGLLGTVINAAQSAQQARLEGREAAALEPAAIEVDFEAAIPPRPPVPEPPAASARMPKDATDAPTRTPDPFDAPATQETGNAPLTPEKPKRYWQIKQEQDDIKFAEELADAQMPK